MSRAFVKEDAGGEDVLVAARPPLPEGSPNLVTAEGLRLLESEYATLQTERQTQAQASDDPQRVRKLAALDVEIDSLRERLANAKLTELPAAPLDKVAFGAIVTAQVQNGKFAGEERRVQIVGVDEAQTGEDKIAFSSPLAKALLGAQLGEDVRLEIAGKPQVLKILKLE